MSVFIKGFLACLVGPLKLSLRISSFCYHLLSWRSITGPRWSPLRGVKTPAPKVVMHVIGSSMIEENSWLREQEKYLAQDIMPRNYWHNRNVKYLALEFPCQIIFAQPITGQTLTNWLTPLFTCSSLTLSGKYKGVCNVYMMHLTIGPCACQKDYKVLKESPSKNALLLRLK